jgi:hypothetical protein
MGLNSVIWCRLPGSTEDAQYGFRPLLTLQFEAHAFHFGGSTSHSVARLILSTCRGAFPATVLGIYI